jgi:hypothetical protein
MNNPDKPREAQEFRDFVVACTDRRTLMAALLGYAEEFMTHRMLIRLKKGTFCPFEVQGWPDALNAPAKRPKLRRLKVPGAEMDAQIRGALGGGEAVVGRPADFGFERIVEFLGGPTDREWLCEPVRAGTTTKWLLLGLPIRIDPNSARFSEDAARLNFSLLDEACARVGAQYHRLGRPAQPSKPAKPAIAEQPARPAPSRETAPQPRPADENVPMTTDSFQVLIDARTMVELNYDQNTGDGDADDAPMLADIENTSAIKLDTSVLRDSKALYREAMAREKAAFDASGRPAASKRPPRSTRPVDAPLSEQEKEEIKRAVALLSAPRLDPAERDDAFHAAAFLAEFGPRGLPTLDRIFPGCLVIDRYQYSTRDLPPIDRHGPVLFALSAIGQPAAEVARRFLDHSSNDLRFYATYLFAGISAADDLEGLYERLFDRDRQTREVAMRVILAERGGFNFEHLILRPLRRDFRNPADETRRLIALETLGQFRDEKIVAELIEMLKFSSDRPKQLAHQALQRITAQNFAASAVVWEQWWRNREVVE